MVHTYQPPLMEVANDTPPELQPIFTFLNSHSNKLYQEGYFLKLHDLDTKGRPSKDRKWQECFAQLVGTVLSLWDAAELDAAGEDGEVVPTFINLADASIKMIHSLPMNEGDGSQLQNVLSISTAASNRYLLHFNSYNSLTQWTSGIRLAMYEYATLQEAYTGSLVAGKGKTLNNIRQILERNRFKYEDWARVRFGAGTPWRRCWFVITPPDEKEWEKAQKMAKKNKYAKPPVLKGDIKFYETRKVTKRTRPIATITNAYSAYAIYPQSKPLIDQSTLVKIEGKITVHSMPESVTEGFVFVMPEVHPAISGFEMMLRFLFPVWDTFALYGRPHRLIADVLDQRGLMFAMPRDRRYGYLDILDVAAQINTEGSSTWTERQWRLKLKELTSKRMLAMADEPRRKVQSRTSMPGVRSNTLRFEDSGRNPPAGHNPPRRAESAMAGTIQREDSGHRRAASEANGLNPYQRDGSVRLNQSTSAIHEQDDEPPAPPPHSTFTSSESVAQLANVSSGTPSPDQDIPVEVKAMATRSPPPAPVDPPNFTHAPSERPRNRPNQAPEIRRGVSDLDAETRAQMAEATGSNAQVPQSAPPPYDPNGAASVHGQAPYSMQSSSRGTSPDSRGAANYRRNGPNVPQLATIPASPYVEQESPILDRAGQVLPPPTVSELAPSVVSNLSTATTTTTTTTTTSRATTTTTANNNLAATAAMAALSATPPYTKSPSPTLANNPVEQAYNLYKTSSNSSNSSLQKVATSGSTKSGAAVLEHKFSVQRKPVGTRASGQNQLAAVTGVNPLANPQWNPQRYSYQSPEPVYGQMSPYGQQEGYVPSAPTQVHGQLQATGPPMQSNVYHLPYSQSSSEHNSSPPQQPPPPSSYGQMAYRPTAQTNSTSQPNGRSWT
ncbi:hypothetical protein, variant [Verruconis gallopava]|nr:hypothetical protein, variant [Verruconis gallopava]KIW07456.1 hypothetical protein, variant [Verruconis gallopava]